MITKIDKDKLYDLIKSFYNLTGIKAAVYDSEFHEILAYPKNNSEFCQIVHNNPSSSDKCDECMKQLCAKCALEKKVINEICHAGLNEVIAPLTDGVSVIGYIMFGQITNEENRNIFTKSVIEKCKDYRLTSSDVNNALEKILCYSDKQIDDASKILKALAGYIVYDKIAYSAKTPYAQKIIEYIRANLSEKLDVNELCKVFYLSKSKIYKITRECMPDGIAAFIKRERIEKAAELLRYTNKQSFEIAEETGFSDVNYFLRTFKAVMGTSASSYRSKFD